MGVPQSVMMATNLMFLSLGLSVIGYIVTVTSTFAASAAGGMMAGVAGIVGLVIGGAITILLALMMRQRKNWARIVFLVLVGLGLLGTVFTISSVFSMSAISGVVSLAQLAVNCYAAFLLIQPPAASWFKGSMV